MPAARSKLLPDRTNDVVGTLIRLNYSMVTATMIIEGCSETVIAASSRCADPDEAHKPKSLKASKNGVVPTSIVGSQRQHFNWPDPRSSGLN
jgi:hypothetical protein